MANKTIRRLKRKTINYLSKTESYGDLLSAKELRAINRKVAGRIAKKRAGLRGRRK